MIFPCYDLTLSIRFATLCAIAQACTMAHNAVKRIERVNDQTDLWAYVATSFCGHGVQDD